MRSILHFMGMNSTKLGGIEKFMLKLIDRFPDDRFVLVYDSVPFSKQYCEELKDRGVIIEICSFSSSNLIKHIYDYNRIISKYRPTIVHFHFSPTHFWGAMIAKLYRVNKIYKTQHSCITDFSCNQVHSFSSLSLKQKLLSLFGYANRFYDKLLFVSDYTLKQYADIYGASNRYERVYLGIYPAVIFDKISRNDLSINEGETILSTIAFANPIKGVDVLIKALSLVENCILILIGLDDSKYTDYLRKLADEYSVSDRIRWIGITDEPLEYLRLSDIYIQPSRTEALSLAACEALSLGIPVVGSNVGGLPEVSSLLFETGNYVELSTVLQGLIRDSNLYQRLRHEALDKFNTLFDIHNGIETYASLYESNT